jgi:hypothetical protein
MSLLGKILLVLNLLGAAGLVYMMKENYVKKKQWQRANLIHDIVISGLPVNDQETDKHGDKIVDKLGEVILGELITQGEKVATQVDEAKRVRKATQAALDSIEAPMRITEKSLNALRTGLGGDPVPEAVLAKVAVLKDRTFDNKTFLEELGKVLDKPEMDRFQSPILKYAQDEVGKKGRQLVLYARYLQPFAVTYAQRDKLNILRQNLGDESKADALKDNFKQAFRLALEIMKPSPQKRFFDEAYVEAVRIQQGERKDTIAEALLLNLPRGGAGFITVTDKTLAVLREDKQLPDAAVSAVSALANKQFERAAFMKELAALKEDEQNLVLNRVEKKDAFKVTEKTLAALTGDKASAPLVAKLTALKDRTLDRPAFLAELVGLTVEEQNLALKYANTRNEFFEEALLKAAMPMDAANNLAEAFLQEVQNEKGKPFADLFGKAYDQTIESQWATARQQLDNLFFEAVDGQRRLTDGTTKVLSKENQKRAVVHLLFNMVETTLPFKLTEQAMTAAAVPDAVRLKLKDVKDKDFKTQEDLWREVAKVLAADEQASFESVLLYAAQPKLTPITENPAYKRVIAVVGVQIIPSEIEAQAVVLRAMKEDLATAIEAEQLAFKLEHQKLIENLKNYAASLEKVKLRLADANKSLQEKDALVQKTRDHIKEATADLQNAQMETKARMKELRDMSGELYKIRLQARDVNRLNHEFEREINALEDRVP